MLAPAGSPEAGYAALHYGADALYLGLPRFSARADADNFTLDQLSDITGFAHALSPRRSVYVAVNTVVGQREWPALVRVLADIRDLGVDAVIVQDLGVYRMIRRFFPELHVHASTQMAIHNRYGVEAARELGIERVILARELSLNEIAECSAVPGIGTEVFIHGALCYSYSGLCLFSSLRRGRSGNCGKCAYLCREGFHLLDDSSPTAGAPRDEFIFSMKDLALPQALGDLKAAGVAALKIEGRKKSPLYVAAVVNYYRRLLDGTVSGAEAEKLAQEIRTIFSRPWTALYLHDQPEPVTDRLFMGHRGQVVGQVASTTRRPDGIACLRFKTDRPLERHDGLQIDIPGLARPFGFPVNELRVVNAREAAGRTTYEAPAGAWVDILLPKDAPAIPPQAMVYCSSSQAVKRSYAYDTPKPGLYRARLPVQVALTLTATGVAAKASLTAPGGIRAEVEKNEPGTFAAADNAPGMIQSIRSAFERFGATPFRLDTIEVQGDPIRFVPVSVLNRIRRSVSEALAEQWSLARESALAGVVSGLAGAADSAPAVERLPSLAAASPSPSPGPGLERPAPRWSLKVDRASSIPAWTAVEGATVDEVFVEIAQDSLHDIRAGLRAVGRQMDRERIWLSLPVISRDWELGALAEKIRCLWQEGWRRWEVANLGGWGLLRDVTRGEKAETGIWAADWPLYALNHMAIEQLTALGFQRVTLSPEDSGANLKALLPQKGIDVQVIVYQDTPLMVSETCVVSDRPCHKKSGSCRQSERGYESAGAGLIRVVSRQCRMVVMDQRPLCLAPQVPELCQWGARRVRAEFMYRHYEPYEVRTVWNQLQQGESIRPSQTGNFGRELE